MEANADLRPPLPPDHPFPVLDSQTSKQTLRSILCRMYVATDIMELGTEARFTSLVLFQRYYFASLVGNSEDGGSAKNDCTDDHTTRREQREHMGTVAAACLFLGCKIEEEHRRIRDVINLSRMLDFAGCNGDDIERIKQSHDEATADATAASAANNNQQEATASSSVLLQNYTTIHIHEAEKPPDLDDEYWHAKESIVSTEQEVLRMLRFDASVCHPHRAVLLILDGLGLANEKKLVQEAWKLLNNSLFHPPALRQPLLPLACGAIRLAERMINSMGGANDNEERNQKKILMPSNWWAALDVKDSEIKDAALSLQDAITALNFS